VSHATRRRWSKVPDGVTDAAGGWARGRFVGTERTPVIPVVAVLMIVGGGGAAAHALSDMDAGHPWHSLRSDVGLLLAAVLTLVLGLLLQL
jgi:hypothetical protein